MSGELVVLEKQLEPLSPRLAMALAGLLPTERLIQSILISCERTPALLKCDRQTLFQAALSAACLALPADGVLGQSFIIPFASRAQLIIGFKGFNSLGARGGFVIRGAVVRENDAFEYDIASGKIAHRPKLGNSARIIGAWALAASNALPSLVSVLSIDELLAVKAKSPGAKKPDSPWNDPAIGFPAMCEKTAKRRLARSMPLNVMQLGAVLDEAVEERGKYAWISPESGVHIEGESPIAPTIKNEPVINVSSDEFKNLPPQLAAEAARLRDYYNSAQSTVQLNNRRARKEVVALLEQIEIADAHSLDALRDVFDKRHVVLTELEESINA